MRRYVLICALTGAMAPLAACDRERPAPEMSALVGLGGNLYCVSDADELALKSRANTDPMASWILIHHYNYCEPDKNRSAQLLKMQMDRGDKVMMESLEAFSARIEAGRKKIAEAK